MALMHPREPTMKKKKQPFSSNAALRWTLQPLP
jgi:hypothetical protein